MIIMSLYVESSLLVNLCIKSDEWDDGAEAINWNIKSASFDVLTRVDISVKYKIRIIP